MSRFVGFYRTMETKRFASRQGANRQGEAGTGKRTLTREEKQHIRAETKQIVMRVSLFENCARASDECVDEAVNKKRAAVTARQKSDQAEWA